jgi:ABC-type nitrate/sulfonate/bicarbonate transport system substrate-binding protein
MLQALLSSAKLTPDDVKIVEYPDFGQGAAVAQGAVEPATGFANNEPVQLELSGHAGVRAPQSTTSRRCPGPG